MQVTKKFIPSICKASKDDQGNEIAAKYEGHVIIRVPDFDERQEFLLVPEMDEVIDAAAAANRGESDASAVIDQKVNAKRSMAIVKNLKKNLKDWVVSIEIKRLDDGFVFTSLDECRMDSEVGIISQEIAIDLLGKYRWGNQSTPQN